MKSRDRTGLERITKIRETNSKIEKEFKMRTFDNKYNYFVAIIFAANEDDLLMKKKQYKINEGESSFLFNIEDIFGLEINVMMNDEDIISKLEEVNKKPKTQILLVDPTDEVIGLLVSKDDIPLSNISMYFNFENIDLPNYNYIYKPDNYDQLNYYLRKLVIYKTEPIKKIKYITKNIEIKGNVFQILEIPENDNQYGKYELFDVPYLVKYFIETSSNCVFGRLMQYSGTCYFNAAINSIILCDNFRKLFLDIFIQGIDIYLSDDDKEYIKKRELRVSGCPKKTTDNKLISLLRIMYNVFLKQEVLRRTTYNNTNKDYMRQFAKEGGFAQDVIVDYLQSAKINFIDINVNDKSIEFWSSLTFYKLFPSKKYNKYKYSFDQWETNDLTQFAENMTCLCINFSSKKNLDRLFDALKRKGEIFFSNDMYQKIDIYKKIEMTINKQIYNPTADKNKIILIKENFIFSHIFITILSTDKEDHQILGFICNGMPKIFDSNGYVFSFDWTKFFDDIDIYDDYDDNYGEYYGIADEDSFYKKQFIDMMNYCYNCNSFYDLDFYSVYIAENANTNKLTTLTLLQQLQDKFDRI